jgi:aspartate oxidase
MQSKVNENKVADTYNDKELSLANLQELMWENVGMIRSADNLEKAVRQLSNWFVEGGDLKSNSPESIELKLMVIVALLTSTTALMRTESRGTHYRSDYPLESETWRKHIISEQQKDT